MPTAIIKVRDKDGNIIDIPALKGDKGDRGDIGPAGPRGLQGEPGKDGITQIVDSTYNANSDNAQSGKAVAGALPPIEKSEGANSLQQKLNRTVFTVANEKINESTDINKNEAGEIISGAFGDYSSIFGGSAQAKGKRSTASGSNTVALGGYSHAEGNETFAAGTNSHTEGLLTTALGNNSHAEGDGTLTEGIASHAEGYNTAAKGPASHSEGTGTVAGSDSQHVQGAYNIEDSKNRYSHIVGNGNEDTPHNAHTIDWTGNAWFAGDVFVGGNEQYEGRKLLVEGDLYGKADLLSKVIKIDSLNKHTFENGTVIYSYDFEGAISAEFKGKNLEIYVFSNNNVIPYLAINDTDIHYTSAMDDNGDIMQVWEELSPNDFPLTFISGNSVVNAINNINVFQDICSIAIGEEAHTILNQISEEHEAGLIIKAYNSINKVPKEYVEELPSIAEQTTKSAKNIADLEKKMDNHPYGLLYDAETVTQVLNIDKFGWEKTNPDMPTLINNVPILTVGAVGRFSAAFNGLSRADGEFSFASGRRTFAHGVSSHTEGKDTYAEGENTHAEGLLSSAIGHNSHAEGVNTDAIGYASHAEGEGCIASGNQSHAEGVCTEATGDAQHVEGRFNIPDVDEDGTPKNRYVHVTGNGIDNDNRSNAHTIDWEGNAWYKGDVYVGGTSQDDESKKLATEKYVYDQIGDIETALENIIAKYGLGGETV